MKQIGRKIIRLESVDSTNNYVANLIKQGGIEHGSVIMAVDQYAGRGQRDAEWLSNAGLNLTFSLYLDDVNLSVNRQFILTELISIALVQLLSKFSIEAKIKWPNDIYVKRKKIAGVLIENQLSGKKIKNTIIGVGLNVNQIDFSMPNTSSIILEKGNRMNLDEVLFSFIETFNFIIKENYSGDDSSLRDLYLKDLYLINQSSLFISNQKQFKGEITGVSDGGLLIIKEKGTEKMYDLKEIQFKN